MPACSSPTVAALLWVTAHVPHAQFTPHHLERAISVSSEPVFQYLLEQGYEVSRNAYELAAAQQDMSILRQLIETGFVEMTETLQKDMYCAAAGAGNVLTIRYLHETLEFPWDEARLTEAALYAPDGYEVLQYMKTQGVTYKKQQLDDLLELWGVNNESIQHHSCGAWLLQQGADWPEVLGFINTSGKRVEWLHHNVKWARSQRCDKQVPDMEHVD
jgi:hypothetical protein